MNGIETEKKKSTLTSILRWIFGVFFVLACVGALVDFNIIAGFLFLLAAIIAIPPTSTQLENKLNFKMSGIVRFFTVFIVLMLASSALPNTPVATNNTTAIAVPSDSVHVTTPTSTTYDNKGTLDIITSPAGASVTVDGVSYGLAPVQGLSLDKGKHIVDLYLSGYEAKTLTVDISSADKKSIDWDFIPYVNSISKSKEASEITSAETTTSESAKAQVTSTDSKTSTISDTASTNTASSSKNSKSTSTTTLSTINTDSSLIIGNSNTHVYHSASCSWVDKISAEHLVKFSSRQEAEAAGYRACKKCGG